MNISEKYKNITSEERLKLGKNAGIVGIVSNLFLFAVKILVGIFGGSVAVIADAINNLSDAGSSIFVFVGYTLSGRPADKEHPYGHARMEYLCGLFISVIVTMLGLEMLKSSVEKIIEGGDSEPFSMLSVIIMSSTVLVKLAMAAFYRKMGKAINSQSLKASAIDSIGDVGATLAVVIGMLLAPVTGPLTDPILGCLIAVYIIVLGIKLIRESSDTLLGVAPGVDFVSGIVTKLRAYDGVLGIHDLMIHSYGADRCFASVHVEVDSAADVMESHNLIDDIEEDFRRDENIFLVIHLDPVNIHDERTNELRAAVEHIISGIAAEYSSPVSMHDFRVVFGTTHSNVLFDIAVSNEMSLDDTSLSTLIAGEVRKIDPTYNTVLTIDRDYVSTRYGDRI